MGFLKYVRAQWDRTGAVVAALAGLVALQLGWLGVSGTEFLAKQMPYVVSGGLLGLFLLGVGSTLWISADLRDEWRQLRSLEAAVKSVAERLDSSEATANAPAPPSSTLNGSTSTATKPRRQIRVSSR